jgi:hypothetical protein
MRPRPIALLSFVLGFAAVVVLLRRSFARRPARVDVYFDDGTMSTYVEGSHEASVLLSAARDALAAARA